MPQGITVWDDAGNVVMDVTTRLTRYLGEIVIPWTDLDEHTITDDGFLTGTPFYICNNWYRDSLSLQEPTLASYVRVSFSGNTMTYQLHRIYEIAVTPRPYYEIVLGYGVY